jgi:RimJ/RimL family protein N-acetyltransferase
MFGPLVGKRCRLRDFTQRDLAEFARYRAIPEVARFQSWTDYSFADAQKLFIAQAGTRFGRDGSWYQVAIAANQDGVLLGDCALHFLEDGRQLEIGFTVAPEHQGRGIAREALSLLLDHAFGTMKTHRVIAAALGLCMHPHYKENVFFKGRWGDECLYAMLSGEWAKKKD